MSASRLALAEALDLRAAEPLLSVIRSRRGAPLVLDGAPVERIGALCLQVLLCARSAWALDGQPFEIENPSIALRETCMLMGADVLVSGPVALETA